MKSYSIKDVTIQMFPVTSVAIMAHRGSPNGLPKTIRNFITWRRAAGLDRDKSGTFTVFHSPQATAGDDFSVDLCAATGQPIPANQFGVSAGILPGGRCAVLRVVGESENLEAPALFLYRDWLPASGEEARTFHYFANG